jgi:hypothetical protein
MKWYRLDYQWGSAGEHWYLKGGVSNAATSEFETLATIAGDLLLTLPPTAVAREALAARKAKCRWYLALWHHMTRMVPDTTAFEKSGRIFVGTIQEPVSLSATLCRQFSTVVLEPPTSPPTPLSRWGRAIRWVGHQYQEHAALWNLVGVLVTVVLAILAIL